MMEQSGASPTHELLPRIHPEGSWGCRCGITVSFSPDVASAQKSFLDHLRGAGASPTPRCPKCGVSFARWCLGAECISEPHPWHAVVGEVAASPLPTPQCEYRTASPYFKRKMLCCTLSKGHAGEHAFITDDIDLTQAASPLPTKKKAREKLMVTIMKFAANQIPVGEMWGAIDSFGASPLPTAPTKQEEIAIYEQHMADLVANWEEKPIPPVDRVWINGYRQGWMQCLMRNKAGAASPTAPQLKLWAERSRAARQQWLESFGVPISNEFAQFAEAIGTLIELAERAGAASPTAPLEKSEEK